MAGRTVIGVAGGVVIGIISSAAVRIVNGIGGVAGSRVRDIYIANKGLLKSVGTTIVNLFKVKLSWSCKVIVIISLILIRVKLISSSIYLWGSFLLIISISTLLKKYFLSCLTIYTPFLTNSYRFLFEYWIILI